MGRVQQKYRKVYVGDKLCATLREAALIAGLPHSTLCIRLKQGPYLHNGLVIKDAPPAEAVNLPASMPSCKLGKEHKVKRKRKKRIPRIILGNPWPGTFRGWGPVTRRLERDDILFAAHIR